MLVIKKRRGLEEEPEARNASGFECIRRKEQQKRQNTQTRVGGGYLYERKTRAVKTTTPNRTKELKEQ